MTHHSRIPSANRGAALILAVLAVALIAAVALSLVVVIQTELRIASNFVDGRKALYAADGAIELAARELLAADWDTVLAGAVSAFADGAPTGTRSLPDGRTIDLGSLTAVARAEPRPWGANNPYWQLFGFGPLGSDTYVIVWVADDPAENDADPLHDGTGMGNPGAGVLAVRARAYATGGGERTIEATIGRGVGPLAQPTVRVLSWQEAR